MKDIEITYLVWSSSEEYIANYEYVILASYPSEMAAWNTAFAIARTLIQKGHIISSMRNRQHTNPMDWPLPSI